MRILSLVRVSEFGPAGGFSLAALVFLLGLWVTLGHQTRAHDTSSPAPVTEDHTDSSPARATATPDFPAGVAILGATTKVAPPEADSSRKRLIPPDAASRLLASPIDHRYPGRHSTCVLARAQRVDPAFLGCFLI